MSLTDLRAVSLRRLLRGASFVGCGDIASTHVTDHHADCRSGSVFAAIRGTRHDGHRYVHEAIAAGAAGLLVSRPLTDVFLPQCVVPCVRDAYSRVCLALAGSPDRQLHLTGVTGTNGKTTVSWLLRSIFRAAGHQVGLLGTIEYCTGRHSRPADLTTPAAGQCAGLLRDMVAAGSTRAVMELSSHALAQSRLGGLMLRAAIVTNVTQDHFDYHSDMAGYLAAKEMIGSHCGADAPLVVNADDCGARELLSRWEHRHVVTFGVNSSADATAQVLETSANATRLLLRLPTLELDVTVPLVGQHNVSNCLAAATAACLDGVSSDQIVAGLRQVSFVPGRLQPVELGQDFRVFVDYAHTPDALSHVLAALRPTTSGRLFCVFGAGGDRDVSKRPLLGRSASAADVVVLTSDNPRTEDPGEIINQVQTGLSHSQCHVEVERGAAIAWAIRHARRGDCVLIAGKGHERIQQLGETPVPFDDVQVASSLIASGAAPHFLSTDRSREGAWTP